MRGPPRAQTARHLGAQMDGSRAAGPGFRNAPRRSQVDKCGPLRRPGFPGARRRRPPSTPALAGAEPVLMTVRFHCKESQPGSGAAAAAGPRRTKASYILNEGEAQPRPP